jgi:hypothetical protein
MTQPDDTLKIIDGLRGTAVPVGMAAVVADPTHGERLTWDISADLRQWCDGHSLHTLRPLLTEAADKLDGLIELLAEAEQARDTARAEADTWWKRSETQVDTIASLRQHSETLNSVAYAARLQQTITESAARVLAKERDQALKRVRELEDAAGVDPFEPPAREAQTR